MILMSELKNAVTAILKLRGLTPETSDTKVLYEAVSQAAMERLLPRWKPEPGRKRACYFSAEFLVGRLVYANLMNLGLLDECAAFLKEHGLELSVFEDIEDDALGNGGLGRLAACFLDSAATQNLPLDGYGIRYRYGLFKQTFENGFQKEAADDWLRFGDPWSVRREEDSVLVSFRDQRVWAVPYDMPVIGFDGGLVNTLRLWQSEPENAFHFDLFNQQKYEEAMSEKNRAEAISCLLYPNDDTSEGKRLRLKQQYFFSSASLQSIVRTYRKAHGDDFSSFSKEYAIQLNDTHPVVSIPELLRILMVEAYLPFEEAFSLVREVFAYTNHTIMAEALEKWDVELFLSVIPEVYPYVVIIQDALRRKLREKGLLLHGAADYRIIADGRIHMARLAIYSTHSTNGVAKIHSEILKTTALPEWYRLYPERFNNKTNGITQRRWLGLCNRELSAFLTERIGNGWMKNLDELERIAPYANDAASLEEFRRIKTEKKRQLCAYIQKAEGVTLDPGMIFDVQVKRLHEYKRQLLNAFSILDLYFGIKDGTIGKLPPTAFLFGAKAAPGYYRAKGIIKFINEIARLIDKDPAVKGILQVVFVQNYNVSYAEKLIPAADISEQISTAGTEASGTSNMKFMLNGAVTLGTLDGANIEIVDRAGRENNYIFGVTVEELAALEGHYDPKALYKNSPRIKRVLDTLVDGTLDDCKSGMFRELYDALLEGASWHKPDHYYLLQDFESYCDTRLRAIRDYEDRAGFAKKCLVNTAHAGQFSSDRTILEYGKEIWRL